MTEVKGRAEIHSDTAFSPLHAVERAPRVSWKLGNGRDTLLLQSDGGVS